jgi:hypothetical protein
MSNPSPKQAWWHGEMMKLIPADVEFDRDLPETSFDTSRKIDEAKLVALPHPGQFGQLRRMAADFGVPNLWTVPKTYAVAQRIIDRFNSEPITESMLTRLATLETDAFGQPGDLVDVRGERFYQREKLANEALEKQSIDALIAAALDPGDAGRQHATELQADEVEPESENTSVKRNARGRRA